MLRIYYMKSCVVFTEKGQRSLSFPISLEELLKSETQDFEILLKMSHWHFLL